MEPFSNTFLNIIQSPSRFYIIPQLLLDYLFSCIIINNFKKISIYLKLFLIIVFCLIFQYNIQSQYINQIVYSNSNNNISVNNKNSHITNNRFFNLMGDNDYYPKATLNDNIVQYIINNKESNINNVNFNNYGNGVIHFDNQQNNKYVVLPYLYYNGINYDVSINNKHYKIHHDQNSLLKVLNFPKGKGIIIVKSNIMLTNILCI